MPEHRNPPEFPWRKGKSDDYTSYVVEVHVCQDSSGALFSHHTYQSQTDQRLAESLRTMGEEQTSFSLFLEACRREAFLSILARLTEDREFMARYVQGGDESRLEVETEVANQFASIMLRNVSKVASGVAAEVLAMMGANLSTEEDPSSGEGT